MAKKFIELNNLSRFWAQVKTYLSANYTAALSGDVTYYVNAGTGSDTTGTGSSGSPFATINKALAMLPKNLNGYTATVQLAGTTAAAGFTAAGFHGGELKIIGLSAVKVGPSVIRDCTRVYLETYYADATTGILLDVYHSEIYGGRAYLSPSSTSSYILLRLSDHSVWRCGLTLGATSTENVQMVDSTVYLDEYGISTTDASFGITSNSKSLWIGKGLQTVFPTWNGSWEGVYIPISGDSATSVHLGEATASVDGLLTKEDFSKLAAYPTVGTSDDYKVLAVNDSDQALFQNLGALMGSLPNALTDTTLDAADEFAVVDSSASDEGKRLTVADLAEYLFRTEAVTFTRNSSVADADSGFTVVAYPELRQVFFRGYMEAAGTLATSTRHTVGTVDSAYKPGSRHALAASRANAASQILNADISNVDGTIGLITSASLSANNAVYISGSWRY